MNIFAVSPNPVECAQALDDKRVVKMVLETAQLLSNCHENGPYKKTHLNHPVAKWVMQSSFNRGWCMLLFRCLLDEYTHRYYKIHKCERLFWQFIGVYKTAFEHEPFIKCTPGFEHITNVHEAYKQYLIHKWNNDKREPKWTNRERPVWYV